MSAQRQYYNQPVLQQWTSLQAIQPPSPPTSELVSEALREKLAVCLLEHIRIEAVSNKTLPEVPVSNVFSSDVNDWIAEKTTEQAHSAIKATNASVSSDDPWQLVQSIVWALTLTGMILLLGPSILASAIGDSLGSVQF